MVADSPFFCFEVFAWAQRKSMRREFSQGQIEFQNLEVAARVCDRPSGIFAAGDAAKPSSFACVSKQSRMRGILAMPAVFSLPSPFGNLLQAPITSSS